jgi:long-chain acyl-CoA synthetase
METAAGVGLLATAGALHSQGMEPAAAAAGCLGGAILAFKYLLFTSMPRADKKVSSAQSKDAKPGYFQDAKDEEGKPVKEYVGNTKANALPLRDAGCPLVMKEGQLITMDAKKKTLYDMMMGTTQFDKISLFGTCTKQHEFKDALLPDGKPNPKPMIVSTPGTWEYLTYGDAQKKARAFGSCLRTKFGIAPKEKVSIWSMNREEWMLSELACHAYGFVSVSVYDTLGPDAASFIIGDSGATVLCAEPKTFKKIPSLLKDEVYTSNPGKNVKVVICYGQPDQPTKTDLEKAGIKVLGFNEAVAEFMDKIVPDTPPSPSDMATIMYTSGTTGNPKGVKLTHGNLVSTVSAFMITPGITFEEGEIHLSYLPLAHIFEREMQYGLLWVGGTIVFASMGAKFLLPDLGVIRPTLFAGVPKVYENVRDAVARKMTGIKKTLFEKALAAKCADMESGCSYCRLYDILVFSKTKKALGGRVKFCVTGGAPISKDTLQFVVCALGPVIQGYGATETSAAANLTTPLDLAVGHVGPPMCHATVKLVDVPDMNYFSGDKSVYDAGGKAAKTFEAGKVKPGGEVWISGPGVAAGYYDPSVDGLVKGIPSNGMAKKTAEDFCKEGEFSCFKTGDIGSWTDAGCLKIVDRKKNMFKTSLGEYVPVEEVEKVCQDLCPFVDFVFLPKETKVSYIALCCVVSESTGVVMKWAKDVPALAGKGEKDVVESNEFKQMLCEEFKKAAQAKKLMPFLHIKSKTNIHTEWQPLGYQESWVEGIMCPNGHKEQLLTATFKARRTQLDQYFAKAFPKIYPDRPADHILP